MRASFYDLRNWLKSANFADISLTNLKSFQPPEALAMDNPVPVARIGGADWAVLNRAFPAAGILGKAGVF